MAGGTIMAITRTWIGGGNNEASNPSDWSPTGIPQPGDTLQLTSGSTPLMMNVSGNDLAGDTLDIPFDSAPLTMNMSHKAAADVNVSIGADGGTYNLTQRSTLNTTVTGSSSQVVNVSGSDRFSTTGDEDMLKVNVASGSIWTGTFSLEGDSQLTASGGSHSVFINDGASELSFLASAVLDLRVLGKGSFSLADTHGFLTFGSSVGAGQSVSIPGDPLSEVVIDQPNKFHGTITLGDGSSVGGETIDLMGLATADSYSFKNDMLSIFSGNTVIDKLRLTDATPYGFAVEKESGSVNIVAYSSPTTTPVGLPIHI
jgi:hypothetical protein